MSAMDEVAERAREIHRVYEEGGVGAGAASLQVLCVMTACLERLVDELPTEDERAVVDARMARIMELTERQTAAFDLLNERLGQLIERMPVASVSREASRA